LGTGDWLIAEADESDGSFQKLSPEIAIITNIDNDHLDHYKNFENLQKAFFSFAQKIPFYGSVIVCGDDPTVRKVFEHFPKRIYFYGFNKENDYCLSGKNGHYEMFEAGQKLGGFEVKVPGQHNALNSAAAIIAGLKAGFSFAVCQQGLLRFQGVDRRFHYKGEVSGIQVYDDYGHHPTEVAATLQAFREKYPKNRIVVMFQPHRYSRTQTCWTQFLTCFKDCDQLILTDIYAAGEKPIDKITSENLAKEIPNSVYFPKDSQLTARIREQLKTNDIFITLGAGDGWKIGMEILNK
jgi:UDP-N-acetylmuramate--alanine ligase